MDYFPAARACFSVSSTPAWFGKRLSACSHTVSYTHLDVYKRQFRLTRHSGWFMCFTDWRQLPTTRDALQVAGWTGRALVTWDKTEACRPHQGMFRNQSEFILIATRGSIGKEDVYKRQVYT